MSKIAKVIINISMMCVLLLLWAGFYIAHSQVGDSMLRYILYGILILLGAGCFSGYGYYRLKFVRFSDSVCTYMERLLRNEPCNEVQNRETLTSKIIMELEKVKGILETRALQSESEKEEVQKVVSDIAHQLKTPVANIRMYDDMLLYQDMTAAERERFTYIMGQQLDKLEFLIDSLVKMSRLESRMIKLNQTDNSIFQTLALAMNSIAGKAEKKKIELSVDCSTTIRTVFDEKWTAEALENILDNAVKYTKENGEIFVAVRLSEMYVVIQIKDTGKGIAPEHFNDIFKRFYREEDVGQSEGLGIGLYLARNIISLQGGHIMVKSLPGKGSVFSVFLPNKGTIG